MLSGRKAQLLAWKREFAAQDRKIYSRLPHTIEVSAAEQIALEHGKWQGMAVWQELGVGKPRGKVAQGRERMGDRGQNLPHARLISLSSKTVVRGALSSGGRGRRF